MDDLRFEWDPAKDEANQKKHGVAFEEPKTAFFDDFARVIVDPEHTDLEERYILLGMSIKLNILVVCHCHFDEENIVCILSARRADPSERAQYAQYLP
ncbi:MAG: BrnT family toxin [Steroidobacteraceae bacterium]